MYGVPITGDDFYALEHGTVPTNIYEMLKKQSQYEKDFNLSNDSTHIITAKRDADMGEISKSNSEHLLQAIDEYAKLPFSDLRIINHQEPAWIKARNENPNGKILFEDIIENPEAISYIEDNPTFVFVK